MKSGLRSKLLPAACVVIMSWASLPLVAQAETLAEAMAMAYESNPTLARQRSTLRAVDESYIQTFSGLRPNLAFTATLTHSEARQSGSSSTLVNTGNGTLNLNQPIYTGGKVSSQLSATEADILSSRENLRASESDTLAAVIQAYVDVRRDQERLRISQENVRVLERQLEESKARFKVGEITRTDVAQSESRLAVARAGLATSDAQLGISRANYLAAVGQSPGDLAPEPSLAGLLPATIEDAFVKTNENNPQLVSFVYAEQAARARVAAAKAGLRPTVTLRGTYGFNGRGGIANQPPPQLSVYERDITASAVVSVPVFTGGLIESQIRQTTEQANIARSSVEVQRRSSLQRVAQAWNSLQGARANLTASEEQVRASTVAFEGVRQEAQVGLRTTLDVLNAEQELRQAELARINARREEYVAATSVISSIGMLEARNLLPGETLYDPVAAFEDVKKLPGWSPLDAVLEHLDRVGAPSIGAPIATSR
jgi:outer membrane protein